jgi:hypothetical protein
MIDLDAAERAAADLMRALGWTRASRASSLTQCRSMGLVVSLRECKLTVDDFDAEGLEIFRGST